MQADSHLLCFDNEALYIFLQQPLPIACAHCGSFCNHCTDSRSHLEPPLLNQVVNNLLRRVGMNLQFSGQRAYGRKRLPRRKLSTYKCLLGCEDQLIKNGLSGLSFESE